MVVYVVDSTEYFDIKTIIKAIWRIKYIPLCYHIHLIYHQSHIHYFFFLRNFFFFLLVLISNTLIESWKKEHAEID
jgi:hypothetical protein